MLRVRIFQDHRRCLPRTVLNVQLLWYTLMILAVILLYLVIPSRQKRLNVFYREAFIASPRCIHKCITASALCKTAVGFFVWLQAPLLIDPVNQGTGNLHSPVAVLTATLSPRQRWKYRCACLRKRFKGSRSVGGEVARQWSLRMWD